MEKKVTPPSFPWEKGHTEEYSCFSLEVKICQSRAGEVWSLHDYMTEEDEKIASAIHSGGIEQIVFSLFTEAVRREAFLEALVRESQSAGFLKRCLEKDTKDQAQEELRQSILKVSKNLIDNLVEGAVTEILSMLVND